MKFIPTMNFNGQCREAMEMYRKAFGGMATALLTYGEVNDPAYLLPEEQKNWIYHGELTFGDQRIIMSDHVDMHFETCYTNFLTVMMDKKEQVTAVWEIMKEGSTVIYPRINFLQFSPGGICRPLRDPLGNHDRKG